MVDELDGLREQLRGRIDTCWDRLEDAVSELTGLHEIRVEEIIDRIARQAEDGAAGVVEEST